MSDQNSISRRSFLKQTVAFSALAAIQPGAVFGQQMAPPPDRGAAHMLMIGDWGTDKYLEQQIAVSNGMKSYVDVRQVHPESLFLLGDNWYGTLSDDSPRWQSQFEQMYPVSHFPGKAYAVLGNHDYEYKIGNKVEMQLHYAARHQGTRWYMPNRWYSFTWPEKKPIVTFICLDSNLPGTKSDPWPWSFTMTREHRDQQEEWFRQELARSRTTPFVAVIAHHPLYTNGVHKDNKLLIKRWDDLLRQAKVDFYITGHDHDLQHLEFAGHPTSFVVSGGGGAELVNWTTDPKKRGPWGGKVTGFTDFEAKDDAIIIRHLDQNAKELHSFRKHVGGALDLFSPYTG
ncbi:metallophosphoesterase [Terriglobus tenax]|uniref:metallophosphoesterase n=1 Tax=Terriglobus tenax TaxID=1111115 RepID=UPI0021E090BE|nr:metallophosphoesterase [Terriglobus tenax]